MKVLQREDAIKELAFHLGRGIPFGCAPDPYGWAPVSKVESVDAKRHVRYIAMVMDIANAKPITEADVRAALETYATYATQRTDDNVVTLKDTNRKFPENRELYAELEAVLDKRIGEMSVPAVIGILELLKQGVFDRAKENV